MILLRNLIEIKLHKEKMTKLFAFESFVYNLEVCQEEDEKKIITRIKKKTEFVMDKITDENFSEDEGEFQKSNK